MSRNRNYNRAPQAHNNSINKGKSLDKTTPKQSKSKNTLSEDSSIKILQKFDRWLPFAAFLLFALLSIIYLAVKNYDYLYGCQEHSLWLNTSSFFDDYMTSIGGFSQWLGCYFTQYFYYPWLGSVLLILMWGVVYFLTIKVFNLSGKLSVLALAPCVMLLCSEVELGYWMYYNKMPGYWFTYTIAILIMLLGIYIGKFIKGYMKSAYIVVYVLALYPLIGFWGLFGALLLIVKELTGTDKSKFITLGTGIAISVFAPLFYYRQYTTTRSEDIWTVMFPNFQSDKYSEPARLIPFFIICLLLFAFIFIGKYLGMKEENEKQPVKQNKWVGISWPLINVALLACYFLAVSYNNYDDRIFQSELRMYKCLENCDWQGVLDESLNVEGGRTREMILSQNIALFHQGKIGDYMFKYNNVTIPLKLKSYRKSDEKILEDKEKHKDEDMKTFNGDIERDSLHVNLCNVCGPMMYFMYGKCNFAYRWCIENGVEFSFRVDDYKMMTRCAMMSGEDKLAAKYIDILSATTFHKDWAKERLAMLHDRKKYEASEEYKCIHPLYDSFKNALDGDQGLVEMYLISYFCHMNSDNKKFQEATVEFALIQKDIKLFWPRFFKYAELHEQEPMPIHYQEAAYLFGKLEPENVDISKMPFDKEKIINRYSNFTRMTGNLMQMYSNQYADDEIGFTKKVGEECFNEFGDTYWWFYYFSRNVHTY